MGSSGLEPPTSRLSGARSNRLSYEPIVPLFLALLVVKMLRRYAPRISTMLLLE